ncbi:hypothetical protein TcasGA2_TC033088 [Tribolium castaneum]|uniref:Uncharacterized protein n=1 Tax=Tribolium castaneum TaxID=7070 RepID=A0A139WI45_TRICA|nr:hypothetical protein TcasGA2_TC033088 [Tribolium castaneum]
MMLNIREYLSLLVSVDHKRGVLGHRRTIVYAGDMQ